MNSRQLLNLGVPDHCIQSAVDCIISAAKAKSLGHPKQRIKSILDNPSEHLADEHFGSFAKALLEKHEKFVMNPIPFKLWGDMDENTSQQMQNACSVPSAFRGALMPDNHLGYGLPIGGVLASIGTVIPFFVGVDIACSMKLSIFDLPSTAIDRRFNLFCQALENGTQFGTGREWNPPSDHPVMDQDWNITRITHDNRDKAWRQLGTSGSGNHFVELGILTVPESGINQDGLSMPEGQYVALLSHSGSRGPGASICNLYSGIAQDRLPRGYEAFGRAAWLDLESEPGQEYWAAMNLMGDYAAANHDVIHRRVSKLLGSRPIAGVENHHNFAWKETYDGQEVVVHRKGATPAHIGELGIIPGSMATPAFVVVGKGNSDSLNSSSHGAGRLMSRTAARAKFNYKSIKNDLAKKGVTILSAGADEVPYAYKDIHEVMAQQSDLVDIVAQFDPKIVKMCDDGSKNED